MNIQSPAVDDDANGEANGADSIDLNSQPNDNVQPNTMAFDYSV